MLGKRKRGGSNRGNSFRRVKPVEEINFDFNERHAYLTGFHKRRMQRVKHAQEEAAKQQREEKIQQRKELRDERKREVEEHVEAIKRALEKTSDASDDDDDDGDFSSDNLKKHFETKGEHRTKSINHEDQYMDSDVEEAVVTVESVSVTRDGLQQETGDGNVDLASGDAEDARVEDTGKLRKSGSKKDKAGLPKKKKKKFRYESTAERKENRNQIRALKMKRRAKREGK